MKNGFTPYLLMKLREQKKKTEEGNQSQPKQMKWSTKLDFALDEELAQDIKASIAVVMYNKETKF